MGKIQIKRGLTANLPQKAAIAELLYTTQQQISKYENDVQEIPCRHIITLARYYNVSTDYLLGLTDNKDKYW